MTLRSIDNPTPPKYSTLDEIQSEFLNIRIDEGEFKGVVFHYINVQLGGGGADKEGNAALIFNYKVVDNPTSHEDLEDCNIKIRLEHMIAAILYDIVVNTVGRIGSDNENRNNNTKEPAS